MNPASSSDGTTLSRSETGRGLLTVSALAAVSVLIWSYLPILTVFYRRWDSDPQYSHGCLIPFMAVGLVWLRGIPKGDRELRPSWTGLLVLASALVLRSWAAHYYFEWLEWISFIPAVTGVLLLTVGLKILRHVWPSVALLVCMIPLPYRAEVAILQPLQNVATQLSTVVLQTMGFAARHEGHVVWIGETAIGIAQACSGLRMLTGFFALAFAITVVTDSSAWKRVLVLLSAVPVALICNVVRITGTGTVFALTGSVEWQEISHDWLGWAMPALGLAALWAELRLLDAIVIEEPVTDSSQSPTAGTGSRLSGQPIVT